MDPEQFRKHAYKVVDEIVDYYKNVGTQYNVASNVTPGYLCKLLPDSAPQVPESFEEVHRDFYDKIMPGITHWQHPEFYGYFPANTSFPAMLADMYSGMLNPIAFNWVCSPACTELETIVLDWLGKAMQLPAEFLSRGKGGGVIQSTASDAILVCLLAAKKKAIQTYLDKQQEFGQMISLDRFDVCRKLIAYCSEQTHASFAKACLVAGTQSVTIACDSDSQMYGMRIDLLQAQISKDVANDLIPFFVCGTIGTTSTGAVDDLQAIGLIAYAGAAMVCPEFRKYMVGVEHADSYNMNAHKWMLVNFDCSPLWLRDRSVLVDALSITASYYRNKATETGLVTDYRDWQLPLGRRFKSLKLWFVVRMYGISGIQQHIRRCVNLNKGFATLVSQDDRFQLVRQSFSFTVLRLIGTNAENHELLTRVQIHGVLLTGTDIKRHVSTSYPGLHIHNNESTDNHLDNTIVYLIRVVSGNPSVEPYHYDRLWKLISEEADRIITTRNNRI